jgi:sulfur carrier protein
MNETCVRVNGQPEAVAAATIADLVEKRQIGADMRGVAVALNGRVIPRTEWSVTAISPGDSLEIVLAKQGG